MTMYTEDVNYRMRAVFLIIAALGLVLAMLLREAIPDYPRVVAPMALVIFLGVFWLYDALLWKLPGFRVLNFGFAPNLAGEWEGQLTRRVEGGEQLIPVRLKIRQTWSKLLLEMSTPEAVSRNILAGLILRDPSAIVMTWIFEIDGRHTRSLVERGRGVIELTLAHAGTFHSMEGATLTGRIVECAPGEPLAATCIKTGPFYWNPKPF